MRPGNRVEVESAVSVVTISAIKADVGGWVGHSAVHPEMLVEAERRVGDAVAEGLVLDGAVNACGADVNLVVGKDDPIVIVRRKSGLPAVDARLGDRWVPVPEPAGVHAEPAG